MKRERPIPWLPIDSRLFTPFFSFRRPCGLVKLFLFVEMVLALLVVIGTFIFAVLTIFVYNK